MIDRTMDEIMAAIDHLLVDFDAIGRKGMATYRKYPPEFLVEHDSRAQAANIYCHMLAEAERRFVNWPGVVLKDIRGLKVFLIDDVSVIRLKRMDEEGRTRSYPTKQAKDYDLGNTLPGIPPPAARLVAGYLPDPTNTEVVRVQIARPRGSQIEWCAAIVPAEERVDGQRRWTDVTSQGRMTG